ncbi:MAG TPA: hydroxyisourate hydrolase [Candidatus Acidoferrum sp.]|nr:hydroxyisourate hydrolase [Candidatus Acidoferrum sp.]
MKRISTHILDLVRGKPATGVAVRLEKQNAPGDWQLLISAQTDQDGRCEQLVPAGANLSAGIYRLVFDTGSYYAGQQIDALHPLVEVTFYIREHEVKLHIPLLLSPNGYTTYRGS